MKLWVDDLRPAPSGWQWVKTTWQAELALKSNKTIEIISLDHDAGDFANCGGDYIEILKWLEREIHSGNNLHVPIIHLHTQNPVGRMNMRAIIYANNWEEQLSAL